MGPVALVGAEKLEYLLLQQRRHATLHTFESRGYSCLPVIRFITGAAASIMAAGDGFPFVSHEAYRRAQKDDSPGWKDLAGTVSSPNRARLSMYIHSDQPSSESAQFSPMALTLSMIPTVGTERRGTLIEILPDILEKTRRGG